MLKSLPREIDHAACWSLMSESRAPVLIFRSLVCLVSALWLRLQRYARQPFQHAHTLLLLDWTRCTACVLPRRTFACSQWSNVSTCLSCVCSCRCSGDTAAAAGCDCLRLVLCECAARALDCPRRAAAPARLRLGQRLGAESRGGGEAATTVLPAAGPASVTGDEAVVVEREKKRTSKSRGPATARSKLFVGQAVAQ